MRLSSHGSSGVNFLRLRNPTTRGTSFIRSFPLLESASPDQFPAAHADCRECRDAGHFTSDSIVNVGLGTSQFSGDFGDSENFISRSHSVYPLSQTRTAEVKFIQDPAVLPPPSHVPLGYKTRGSHGHKTVNDPLFSSSSLGEVGALARSVVARLLPPR